MIIAAFGQLANGKDTVCDYLFEKVTGKNNWKRAAFANAVKDTFCQSFQVTREFIEEWKRIPEPPPGFILPIRQALQNIGDGFRKIVPTIWIDIALRSTNDLIISDGRYINEAIAVKNKQGLNILIYREGFLNDDPNPSEAQLRPLIEWCAKNLESGPIDSSIYQDYPKDLSHFHYFIKNKDKKDLLKHVDTNLLPFVNNFFNQD